MLTVVIYLFRWETWFFFKLRPHRQQSVCKRVYQKLTARYYGPFQIVQCVGKVAYKLQLPKESRVHPVFHASCLKKALGINMVGESKLPEELEVDLTIKFEPDKILARRLETQGHEQVLQLLIKWKGRKIEDATWDASVLLSQFPNFSLEDKAGF